MQFLLTDPVSPEIILTQSYKKEKTSIFSQVVLLWQHFLLSISTFLVFSRFLSISTYLISWHYHTTGGNNRVTLFLKFGENGDCARCQSAKQMQHRGQMKKGSLQRRSSPASFYPGQVWHGNREKIPLKETPKRNNFEAHRAPESI